MKYEEARDKASESKTYNHEQRKAFEVGADWSRDYHRDIMQRIESHRDGLVKTIEGYEKQNQELLSLLKKVEGVVEFYGDYENWGHCWVDGCTTKEEYYTNIKDDMGSRCGGYKARSILPEIREVLNGNK